MVFPMSRPLRCFAPESSASGHCGFQESNRAASWDFMVLVAAAHVAIQVARHWNVDVFASTRDERHQKLALALGAKWAGGTFDEPREIRQRHCLRTRRRDRSRRLEGAREKAACSHWPEFI